MTHVVTSDTHLGSRYFNPAHFSAFLASLPPEAELIIAGDVVDRPRKALTGAHRAVLEQLIAMAAQRHVVWVLGNNDRGFDTAGLGPIKQVDEYAIDKRLLVVHGHRFDRIMPYHGWFKLLIRALHALRIMLGADAIHVARYAKRFPTLYGVLRRHVARNAVRYAAARGVEAIVCGHTHAAEVRTIDGVRYFNTGAWTEDPPHFLLVTDTEMSLQPFAPGAG